MNLRRIGDISSVIGFIISTATALNVSGLSVMGQWSNSKTVVVGCVFGVLSTYTAWRCLPVRDLGRAFFKVRPKKEVPKEEPESISDIAHNPYVDRSLIKIDWRA